MSCFLTVSTSHPTSSALTPDPDLIRVNIKILCVLMSHEAREEGNAVRPVYNSNDSQIVH